MMVFHLLSPMILMPPCPPPTYYPDGTLDYDGGEAEIYLDGLYAGIHLVDVECNRSVLYGNVVDTNSLVTSFDASEDLSTMSGSFRISGFTPPDIFYLVVQYDNNNEGPDMEYYSEAFTFE